MNATGVNLSEGFVLEKILNKVNGDFPEEKKMRLKLDPVGIFLSDDVCN